MANEEDMRLKTHRLLLVILLVLHFSCVGEEPSRESVPDIPVYRTIEQNIPIYQEFVGQIHGYEDIAIRARVEGFLEGIHFQEGSRVERGALLYSLESQPFEADVAAKMSMLAEARTMLAKAKSDLERIRPLAEQRAVSERDLDSAVAIYDASIASVEAAEANLRAANIQLGYTKISSPISGIIGKTRAKVGDFVGRSPNPVILNVVSRIDTILVEFFITETQYLDVMRRYLSQEFTDTGRQQKAGLELILADGSLYGHTGKIDFIDREVDSATGAILVQASFPNPEEIIRPGQFARVKILVDTIDKGIMIPQRCVTELQGLYRVYIVNEKNEVEIREVAVGPRISDFWLIEEGLNPGEKIVYEGLQRIRAGMLVNPVVREIQPIAPDNR